MRRYLVGIERLAWKGFQDKPVNFGLRARIRGSVSDDQLLIAVAKLKTRHPLSTARVAVDENGVPYFTDEGTVSIPVVRVDPDEVGGDDETAWLRVAEQELGGLFDWAAEPLVRIFRLDIAEDIMDLVIIIHHMIADGLSGAYLLRDLFAYLCDPDMPVVPLPALPPVVELMPQEIRDRVPPADVIIEQIKDAAASGAPSISVDEFLTMETPRLRLHRWRLDETVSGRLIDRCRKEKTTVHGAIGAAFLRAFAERAREVGDGNEMSASTRTLQSPVNIRDRLEPVAGDNFGLFITQAMVDIDCGQGRDFWSIARDVRQGIQAAIADPMFMARMLMMEPLLESDDPEALLRSLPILIDRNYDLSITNLGRLDMPARCGGRGKGNLTIEGVYAPLLQVSPGETILGVNSVGGSIHFALAHEVENDQEAIGVAAMDDLVAAIDASAYQT